ncbi:unnamed protein product [Prunus armeniaca]
MGGGSMKSNPTKARKRVEATEESSVPSLVRGKDGSAFARCEECNRNVPVALISMHSCSLDAKIKLHLSSQVVERPPEANKKSPTERKRSTTSEPKSKKAKKDKDPNAPKRPLTAFFLFMDDFRKSFKEANPDSKLVKTVAKEGGEKWKSMTDEVLFCFFYIVFVFVLSFKVLFRCLSTANGELTIFSCVGCQMCLGEEALCG